jgi:IrrE N-terminal-like domain
MAVALPSTEQINAAAERLLKVAAANGVLPTPVDKLLDAANLRQGDDDVFDEETLARAPRAIREKIRGLGLLKKVRAALGRNERLVYLNPAVENAGRRNFIALHEVGHDILEWQRDLVYIDDDMTLSWSTRTRFEREANQAAAELLFQRDLFASIASDYRISIATVIEMAQMFGGSIQASLRRYVETHRHAVAGVVCEISPVSTEPLAFRRNEAMCSREWMQEFESPAQWPARLDVKLFSFLEVARRAGREGIPLAGEFQWPTLRSEQKRLRFEIFSNSYRLLVLMWVPRREFLKTKTTMSTT